MICIFLNNFIVKMFGYKVKLNFSVENEKVIFIVLKVDFGMSVLVVFVLVY